MGHTVLFTQPKIKNFMFCKLQFWPFVWTGKVISLHILKYNSCCRIFLLLSTCSHESSSLSAFLNFHSFLVRTMVNDEHQNAIRYTSQHYEQAEQSLSTGSSPIVASSPWHLWSASEHYIACHKCKHFGQRILKTHICNADFGKFAILLLHQQVQSISSSDIKSKK